MIFDALELVMDELDLSFDNTVGYGSDGAAVVTGAINSVWSRIQAKKNISRFTCICHSMNKVAESAFAELPSHMSEFLNKIP